MGWVRGGFTLSFRTLFGLFKVKKWRVGVSKKKTNKRESAQGTKRNSHTMRCDINEWIPNILIKLLLIILTVFNVNNQMYALWTWLELLNSYYPTPTSSRVNSFFMAVFPSLFSINIKSTHLKKTISQCLMRKKVHGLMNLKTCWITIIVVWKLLLWY